MPGIVGIHLAQQAAGLGVAQAERDFIPAERRQGVHQVIDVETDTQLGNAAGDFKLLDRFFLLRVVGHDAQPVRADIELDPAILLVGKNGCALQGKTQLLAANPNVLVRTNRNHGLVVREATINEFRGEGHPSARQPEVVATELQIDQPFAGFKQTLQFQHTLARDDDLAAR